MLNVFPSNEVELLLKNRRSSQKPYWKPVMLCGNLYAEDLADLVEDWSNHFKVLGARFNGKEVPLPTKYHWELRRKGEVLGRYSTRKEARNANSPRIGTIVFVKD